MVYYEWGVVGVLKVLRRGECCSVDVVLVVI